MRLSKEQIREIVTAHKDGVSPSVIAERFSINRATVRYHVQKTFRADIFDDGIDRVYALLKIEVQHECQHPSMQCLCCGKLQSAVYRDERVRIQELETLLAARGESSHV